MSQHDFNIANQTFPSFRADLNDALQASATMSAGSSAPTTPYAYQLWFDTTTDTWKVRNSGNTAWISTITTDLATGNVGIGNSSPQSRLDITGAGGGSGVAFKTTDASLNETFYIQDGGRVGVRYTPFTVGIPRTTSPATNAIFQVEEAGYLTVLNSGNVGIGTTSPNNRLQINGGAADTAFQITNSATGSTATDGFSITVENPTPDVVIRNREASNMRFLTSNTERMRIDSDGNLLVGGSNLPGTDNFPANDTSGYGATILVSSTQKGRFSILGDDECSLNVGRHSGTGNVAQWYYSGSIVGSVSVTASATSYNTSSDYRLKEDVQPMTGASDRVLALKPVNFAWKADGSRVDGFLAHEAQEVVPESVTGTKDAVDADGNPVYQGIDQSKLVPLLTAALQEALTKIDALETRIAALEGN